MTLAPDEEDEVRKKCIAQFGEDSVKKMDVHYMELNDIRIASKTSYDFLDNVKAKYSTENCELLIAAILYGMKQGEIGYEYHLKKQEMDRMSKMPKWGDAS